MRTLLAWLLAGCGAVGPVAPASEAPPGVFVVAEAPLAFEANGHELPVPVVHAEVNGNPVTLIVDTGASHTVLTAAFASAHELVSGARVSGTGHADEALAAHMLPPVRLKVGGFERALDDAAVIEAAPQLSALGIDGFLSPQTFRPTGFVALELSRSQTPGGGPLNPKVMSTLTFLDGSPRGLRAWVLERHPGATVTEMTRLAPAPRERNERKVFVRAGLGSRESIPCEIDTGGATSDFGAAYVGRVDEAARDNDGISASGRLVAGKVLQHQTVTVGDLRLVGDVVVRDDMPDGVVGMDALRGLVVVIPSDVSQKVWFVSR